MPLTEGFAALTAVDNQPAVDNEDETRLNVWTSIQMADLRAETAFRSLCQIKVRMPPCTSSKSFAEPSPSNRSLRPCGAVEHAMLLVTQNPTGAHGASNVNVLVQLTLQAGLVQLATYGSPS